MTNFIAITGFFGLVYTVSTVTIAGLVLADSKKS